MGVGCDGVRQAGVTPEYVTDPTRPHLGGNGEGGDPRSWAPELWAWLIGAYLVRSVYDVGCGQGHAMAWFKSQGLDVVGMDGLAQSLVPGTERCDFLVHDLTTGPMAIEHIDLVWCCEVVEHIDRGHAGNLLDTLCCGRVLAMTHATPGQPGYHHVNCQYADYWIERIEARGFRFDRPATYQSRKLGGLWWKNSGLIFVRA
jgi:SAM-dependent methyltransferase